MSALGTVSQLWRYPVKSLLGETLEWCRLTAAGVEGDRGWAVRSVRTGRVVSAKRLAAMLGARAGRRPGAPVVAFPDGGVLSVEDPAIGERLSAWIGEPVEVAPAPSAEEEPEVEREDGTAFRSPPGTFFDGAPVHLLTTATLAFLSKRAPASTFDARRFRPNIVVEAPGEGPLEREWIGSRVQIGDATLEITGACRRCVVTTAAQGELPQDRDILATVARENRNEAGVYARVVTPGGFALGDAVVLKA